MLQSSPAKHSPQRTTSRPTYQQYRKAKALPVQLLDQCTICFEEQLFSQAFSLLSNCLTSGLGDASASHIPPLQHLALAATLVVHPQLTTRTLSPDKHTASDDALKYLQDINILLGAQHAGLHKAYRFHDSDDSIRSKRAKTRQSDVASDEEDETPGRLSLSYVSKESIWTNANDFWAVVGWAFNCSIAYPARWERWKLWLGFLLDVLADDLEARMPAAIQTYQAGGTPAVQAELKDSLIAQYLASIGQGRNNKRRVMRAVFADGKQKSLAEFGEIWRHETQPPKQKQRERFPKKRKLDIENGEYGDYFDDESDEDSRASSIRRSRSATAFSGAQRSRAASENLEESDGETNGSMSPPNPLPSGTVEAFGGMTSVNLRQRLLALLTRLCAANPDAFQDNEDLFDLFTEYLRPLPLSVFQQFVLPSVHYLGPNSQASLNQMLLRPLLMASAPSYNENELTQADFEAHYAPYAANNTNGGDNAKVSLLVESLLRLLWNTRALKPTKSLRQAVEKGVVARKERMSFDGRRKPSAKTREHEEAMAVLQNSSRIMFAVLDMIE